MESNNSLILNNITKAREYAYLGMYNEAINNYNTGLNLINSKLDDRNNRDLYKDWSEVRNKLKKELINIEKIFNIIKSGVVNAKANKNMDYDDKKINEKRLPFDAMPFAFHHNKNMNMNYNNNNYANNNNYNYNSNKPNYNNNYNYPNEINYMTPNIPVLGMQKDPMVWDPPSPRPIKKNIIKKSNNNNNNNNYIDKCNNVKRNYDKPWAEGIKKNQPSKDQVQNKENSPFILHHYPDGHGPDVDLIKMIEKDIMNNSPDITFNDIAGHDKAKSILMENVLLSLKIKNFFTGIRKPCRGVLLYGPPGTGKTMLAKAVATSGKTTFFNVNPATLASKWKGDSEKLVRLLFEMAAFYAPTTIFIDEIDSMLSERSTGEHESNRKVKTQFFVQMDGIASKNEEGKNIILLAATNRPWDLDEAILRRLSKRIYIPLPNEESRKTLFKLKLKDIKLTKDIDWSFLVKKTAGFNADDIENLCKEAAMMPLRKLMKNREYGNIEGLENFEKELIESEITMDDLKNALKNVNSSASEKFLNKYTEWTQNHAST